MTIQNILRVIPIIHSAQLAKMNVDALEKKSSPHDFAKLGVKNIVGVNIVRIESGLISGL